MDVAFDGDFAFAILPFLIGGIVFSLLIRRCIRIKRRQMMMRQAVQQQQFQQQQQQVYVQQMPQYPIHQYPQYTYQMPPQEHSFDQYQPRPQHPQYRPHPQQAPQCAPVIYI